MAIILATCSKYEVADQEKRCSILAMRILLLFIIGLGFAAGVYYVVMQQQTKVMGNVQQQQNAAQEKTDAYKKQQQEMMKQLGQ